ncbi:putative solute-binding protein family 3/ domain of MltF [Helianthus debilis subsp. tardiflorus]
MAQKHSKIFLLLLVLSLLNLQVLCNTLKVGVLTRKNFKYFIDADHDGQKNVTNATGFSLDVFRTCIQALSYEVPYKFIPFTSGGYDDLIKKVYDKEIDAIMGDSTILANRSQYVDFTATYTDMGIGTLAKQNNNDMWIFLKPLEWKLWISIVGFAVLTGLIIWGIESMKEEAAQEIGTTFWVILMTLFFAQRDQKLCNLSKFVLFVWLLVVLILISSYTATLSSLLTVEQFELASKGGTVGFHGGSFESGLAGVTVSNLHFEDYRRKPFYSYEDYAEALSKGRKHGGADAIIDEIPYIKMFLAKYSSDDYAMVSSEPSTSGFAFIFRKGSPLVADMSRQIAKIREDGTLRMLEKKWFEKQSLSSLNTPRKPQALSVGRFKGLFIVSGSSSAFALLISVTCLLQAKLKVERIIAFIMQPNLVATLRFLLNRHAIRV